MAHPEQELISSVLNTADFPLARKQGITQPQFSVFDLEWEFIEDYFSQHRLTPSIAAFQSKFSGFTVLPTTDLIHWANEVRTEYLRSKLNAVLNTAAQSVMDGCSPLEASSFMQRELRTMTSTVVTSNEIDVLQDWMVAHEAATQRAQKAAGGTSGVPTGWISIDLHTGGLQPGELWIPAARPGQGKSWTMARWAAEAVEHGKSALYYSLEMRWDAIAYRVHSILAYKASHEVKSLELMTGKADLTKYASVLQEVVQGTSGRLWVSDASRGRVNVDTVAGGIERQQPDVVFVDYLTLMEHESDWQGVAKLSGELKVLADTYDVPVVAASQINRAGEGKEPPLLGNLSQSDAIGQDADAVVTLAQQSPTVSRYRLAKYRNGRDGYKWFVSFKPGIGMIEEIDANSAQTQMHTDQEDE